MAEKHHSIQIPSKFKHTKRDILQELDFDSDKPPSLLPLIGQNSWFIFDLLNLTRPEDKPWLTCLPTFWPYVDQLKKFSGFVDGLEVNDSSERAIKLVSEFVNSMHDEDDRQDLLLAVQQRRDRLKGAATKAELQAAYEAIVKEQRF